MRHLHEKGGTLEFGVDYISTRMYKIDRSKMQVSSIFAKVIMNCIELVAVVERCIIPYPLIPRYILILKKMMNCELLIYKSAREYILSGETSYREDAKEAVRIYFKKTHKHPNSREPLQIPSRTSLMAMLTKSFLSASENGYFVKLSVVISHFPNVFQKWANGDVDSDSLLSLAEHVSEDAAIKLWQVVAVATYEFGGLEKVLERKFIFVYDDFTNFNHMSCRVHERKKSHAHNIMQTVCKDVEMDMLDCMSTKTRRAIRVSHPVKYPGGRADLVVMRHAARLKETTKPVNKLPDHLRNPMIHFANLPHEVFDVNHPVKNMRHFRTPNELFEWHLHREAKKCLAAIRAELASSGRFNRPPPPPLYHKYKPSTSPQASSSNSSASGAQVDQFAGVPQNSIERGKFLHARTLPHILVRDHITMVRRNPDAVPVFIQNASSSAASETPHVFVAAASESHVAKSNVLALGASSQSVQNISPAQASSLMPTSLSGSQSMMITKANTIPSRHLVNTSIWTPSPVPAWCATAQTARKTVLMGYRPYYATPMQIPRIDMHNALNVPSSSDQLRMYQQTRAYLHAGSMHVDQSHANMSRAGLSYAISSHATPQQQSSSSRAGPSYAISSREIPQQQSSSSRARPPSTEESSHESPVVELSHTQLDEPTKKDVSSKKKLMKSQKATAIVGENVETRSAKTVVRFGDACMNALLNTALTNPEEYEITMSLREREKCVYDFSVPDNEICFIPKTIHDKLTFLSHVLWFQQRYHDASLIRLINAGGILDIEAAMDKMIEKCIKAKPRNGVVLNSCFRGVAMLHAKPLCDITASDMFFLVDASETTVVAMKQSTHDACYKSVKNTIQNSVIRVFREGEKNPIVQPFILEAPFLNFDAPSVARVDAHTSMYIEDDLSETEEISEEEHSGSEVVYETRAASRAKKIPWVNLGARVVGEAPKKPAVKRRQPRIAVSFAAACSDDDNELEEAPRRTKRCRAVGKKWPEL